MEIRFLSSNPYKVEEAQSILQASGVRVLPVKTAKIEEIQSEDVERLVRDKVLQAFQWIGKPIFVEHTGLYLDGLNGLPGGLTQIFWDRLQADAFVSLVTQLASQKVTARTTIGYCDSRKLHFFEGEITGTVPEAPAGPREFQWDCVFVPDGYDQTFAEMGETKREISMRRLALDKMSAFFKKETPCKS